MITIQSLVKEREALKSRIEVQSGPHGTQANRNYYEAKLQVVEYRLEKIKRERALEEDVNFCITSMYEDFTPEELGSILAATLKTHGLDMVLQNLESRNQTTVIADLIIFFQSWDIFRKFPISDYKMGDL